jgi:hypothetical protein
LIDMRKPVIASPRPAKRGEGARAKRGRERGTLQRKEPSPGSRFTLATLSRHAGEGKENALFSTCRTSNPAPADLLDDNAVVGVAFAVTHAGFERFGMHFKERQLLADLARLIEHQVHVF